MNEQPDPYHQGQEAHANEREAVGVPGWKPIVEQTPGQKPKKNYFSKFKNWVTLLTLLFVGAYTLLTYFTLKNSEDTLGTARKANEIASRPYIKIVFKPETFRFAKRPGLPNNFPDTLAIDFSVKNFGKLPAPVDIAATGTLRTQHHDPSPLDSFFEVAKRFMFPDDVETFTAYSPEPDQQTLGEFKTSVPDRVRLIYFAIRISYGPKALALVRGCGLLQLRRCWSG